MRKILLILFAVLSVNGFSQIGSSKSPTSTSYASGAASSNMISNGTFDDGSDWTAVGWTIGSGYAQYDDGSGDQLTQTAANMVTPLEVSTTYDIAFDFGISAGQGIFALWNSDQSISYPITLGTFTGAQWTHYETTFTTPGSIGVGGISFNGSSGSTNVYQIDNLVITPQ